MKVHQQGFTLMEMLISLLVVSLVMQLLLEMTQLVSFYQDQVQEDYTTDFHQLMVLLDHELDDYQVKDAQGQTLYLWNKKEDRSYWVKLSGNRLYKGPGFHPYSYYIQDWQVTWSTPYLWVEVTYDNGQVFSGYILAEGG